MALGRKTGGRQKGTLNRATVIARTAAAKALTARGLHEPREATAAVKLRRRAAFYRQRYDLSIADYEGPSKVDEIRKPLPRWPGAGSICIYFRGVRTQFAFGWPSVCFAGASHLF